LSASYRAVGWNRHKVRYDLVMGACVLGFVGVFMGITFALPTTSAMSPTIALIRALGACAVMMLHVTLAIGPLHRLFPVTAPLLYNRRHLGVCTFAVGAAHAIVATFWYHGFGVLAPPVSVLASNPHAASFVLFPFELFGVLALVILLLMAATSHDFWLRNLSPQTWKTLHMLVYVAYGALMLHVALGVIQLEKASLFPLLIALGGVVLTSLHIAAGWRERKDDRAANAADGWIDAGDADSIPEGRARVVCAPASNGRPGERVAVFKHEGKLCAVGNVCAHQGGPLGEGRIVSGCITCPWHGYQYLPGTGESPPPFHEKVPTYEVRITAGRAMVNTVPKSG
jgi:nitrite reductase/ring-hydroxylating ferredoxin subunit/DMSO/TMAO reductase YedYZ heme-binding membrane subunit